MSDVANRVISTADPTNTKGPAISTVVPTKTAATTKMAAHPRWRAWKPKAYLSTTKACLLNFRIPVSSEITRLRLLLQSRTVPSYLIPITQYIGVIRRNPLIWAHDHPPGMICGGRIWCKQTAPLPLTSLLKSTVILICHNLPCTTRRTSRM